MKKCLNCGAIYNDDSANFCDCGGYLQLIEEKLSQVSQEVEQSVPKSNLNSQELIEEDAKSNDAVLNNSNSLSCDPIYEKIRIQVYNSKKITLDKIFSYDEITLGRSKTNIDVDINLNDLDEKHEISRKHLKIFKSENKYYLLPLSNKAAVLLNDKPLKQNQREELHDGDKIILSRSIGIIVLKVTDSMPNII